MSLLDTLTTAARGHSLRRKMSRKARCETRRVVVALSIAIAFASIGGVGRANASASYESTVLSDAPVGYWPLDETSGMTAADASGNGHDGVYVNGPTLGVPGPPVLAPDTGAGFDGVDQRVDVPYSPALNPATFTLEAWVNPASLPAANSEGGSDSKSIICSRSPDATRGYHLYISSYTGHPQFAAIAGTGTGLRYTYDDSSPPLQTGVWYHVAVTFDGSVLQLYVNGQPVASPQLQSAPFVPNDSNPTRFGMCDHFGDLQYGFDGTLDEIAIYDHVLDASRILARSSPPHSTQPPASFSYYVAPASQKLDTAYLDSLEARGSDAGRNVADGTWHDALGRPRISVILHFGGQEHRNGVWGTHLVSRSKPFVTMAQIRVAALKYAVGFFRTAHTRANSFLTLAVDTNNSWDWTGAPGGMAWAQSITQIDDYLATHGSSADPSKAYARHVHVVGGIDFEAGYGPPDNAVDWVRAYHDTTSNYLLYDGDCAGCPSGTLTKRSSGGAETFTGDTATGGGVGTRGGVRHSWSWQVWQVAYVSYDAGRVLPLPQIYRPDGEMALNWLSIADFVNNARLNPQTGAGGRNPAGPRKMILRGSLTQKGSCDQGNSCVIRDSHGHVIARFDNTPAAGWTQLYDALNGGDPFTEQPRGVRDATDVRYLTR
jgi:hypothetical protein